MLSAAAENEISGMVEYTAYTTNVSRTKTLPKRTDIAPAELRFFLIPKAVPTASPTGKNVARRRSPGTGFLRTKTVAI